MLLLEKVVKLLDDFHFDLFRNFLKNKSVRSYYPMALIDVLDRSFSQSQSIEKLCKAIYSDYDDGIHKKFIQLAHYTFRQTSFLAKNYPDYLFHNIPKIQHLINTGESEKAIQLLEILIEVSAKVEDRNTELAAQQIRAQHYILIEKRDQAIKCFDRVRWLQFQIQQQFEIINYMHTHHALRASNTISKEELEDHLDFFGQYENSESFYVRFLQKCVIFFFLHLSRDKRFYTQATFDGIVACEAEYEKYDFVVTPFLANYIHVLKFLKLHHFIQVAAQEEISKQIPGLLAEGQELLFWESYFNITEYSSLVILSNFYSRNYFFSYKENHLNDIPDEIKNSFELLKNRCERILDNAEFPEKFIIRYINLTTIYSLLLSCGNQEDIKKSTKLLEGLLVNYQQVPFYGLTDSIYTILILGYFCLDDFENVDKCFRRFKKNLKNKTVIPDNDILIQSIFYISKWRATQRSQYVKKLDDLLNNYPKEKLNNADKNIRPIIDYFKVPVNHTF